MTDEYIDYLSGIYIREDIGHRYGWTFAHFIEAHESGYYKRLKLYENVKGRAE